MIMFSLLDSGSTRQVFVNPRKGEVLVKQALHKTQKYAVSDVRVELAGGSVTTFGGFYSKEVRALTHIRFIFPDDQVLTLGVDSGKKVHKFMDRWTKLTGAQTESLSASGA